MDRGIGPQINRSLSRIPSFQKKNGSVTKTDMCQIPDMLSIGIVVLQQSKNIMKNGQIGEMVKKGELI